MGEFTYKNIVKTCQSLVGLYTYHIKDLKAKEEAQKKLEYFDNKNKKVKSYFNQLEIK